MKAASSCVTIANARDDSRLRKRRTKINEATKEDVNIISGMRETKKNIDANSVEFNLKQRISSTIGQFSDRSLGQFWTRYWLKKFLF